VSGEIDRDGDREERVIRRAETETDREERVIRRAETETDREERVIRRVACCLDGRCSYGELDCPLGHALIPKELEYI
jgi:hypothetical protein